MGQAAQGRGTAASRGGLPAGRPRGRWAPGPAGLGGRLLATLDSGEPGPRRAAGAVALGLLSCAEILARLGLDPRSLGLAGPPAPGRAGQAALVLCLLGLAGTLPLAFSRPAAAGLVVTATSLLLLGLFGVLTGAAAVAQLIVSLRLGRDGPLPLALALAAPFPLLALFSPAGGEARVLGVVLASLVPAAALTGAARRARAEALHHSTARSAIAGSLLEHTARGERARISRELHDVVAHHISMIAVQAETARLATPGMPAAGAQRLASIGDTARAALTEMRRLLGVLREDTGSEPAPLAPQPGLAQLNRLLDEARNVSGTAARLIIRGRPVPLDPGAELAAFRIVQEALTNARRHAPGAAVDVELAFAAGDLRLRIRDNGPGPPPGAAAPRGPSRPPGGPGLADGHGLIGMRERAVAAGGELRAGAAAGGGFLIQARLPAPAGPGAESGPASPVMPGSATAAAVMPAVATPESASCAPAAPGPAEAATAAEPGG